MNTESQKCPFCEQKIQMTPCNDCGEYPIINKNRKVVCINIECKKYNKPYNIREW